VAIAVGVASVVALPLHATTKPATHQQASSHRPMDEIRVVFMLPLVPHKARRGKEIFRQPTVRVLVMLTR
jgi:hypothetical protein